MMKKEEEGKIDDRVLSAGSLVKEKEIAILYATLALAGKKMILQKMKKDVFLFFQSHFWPQTSMADKVEINVS